MLNVVLHDEIAELNICRPPANALNQALLDSLLREFQRVLEEGARGVILSGQEGMFCAGIDVPELLGQERSSIRSFWSALFEFSKALATSPVPVVSALAGHSPAGGAVLAGHCDYRIAAQGSFKIGFNEVQVGLPLPSTIVLLFQELVGARVARQLGTRGQLVDMEEALTIGLIDEIVAPDDVLPRCLEWLGGLLDLPPVAMNRTRLAGKSSLIHALNTARDVDQVTEDWFSAETQVAMHALVDSLKNK
jgi:enoyl-CoA hydratase/carnithine racemase